MKRAITTIAGIALLVALVPVLPARAEPAIAFLNPSGYSARLQMSDKADQDNAYHLVSWVREVPANPLVEFEFVSPTGTVNQTIDATRVATDTWDAFLTLGGVPDGQYLLRTRLYENFTGPGTGREVASDEITVTVEAEDVPPPPEANTVEILYPDNGGALGFFNPRGKVTNFLIDGIASEGTDQVRALYSTSPPGTAPEWVSCGSTRVPLEANVMVRARCDLAEGASGMQITAVALVANETPPPADPNAVGDATGDAHRVAPYEQVPQRVFMSPEAVEAGVGTCQILVANTFDQNGRPIAAANIDVHATGPDDQIQFAIIERTTSPQAGVLTSGFKAPDRGHPSERSSYNCGNNEQQGRQGDHNIPGANDPQHIESTDGTDRDGNFTFALRSAIGGPTQVEAWVDADDDDVLQASEAIGGARIGWGQPPPPPVRNILLEPTSASATTGTCQRMVIAAREGGNPLAGVNVDVHASGPNESVAFCAPPDASFGREPDQGSHVAGADDAQTRHLEGETDNSGRFIFGVTAASDGVTNVTVWIDGLDDDTLTSGEPSRLGQVQWAVSGDRSISISSNRNKVRRGRAVRISGAIDGVSSTCETGQVVRLRSKRMRGGNFRTMRSTTTDTDGDYSFRVRVRKSKRYKAVAPASEACEKAVSRTITVRRR